jgi:class 3 adenylate cyclase
VGESRTATVTFLFCDLVDSTALAASLGDAAADDVRRACFDRLRDAVALHRGVEVKSLGDGLMVSFTSNADTIGAAVAMQQHVDALGRERRLPLALRVGVSAGEATFEDGDWFGAPVVEASRLCATAAAGQVLVTDVVRVLLGTRSPHPLRPVGDVSLKGLSDPLTACEVEWSALPRGGEDLPLPRAFALAPRFPLAGREDPLERLVLAWKSVAEAVPAAVLLAGEPGVGKTRLASEIARRAHADGGSVLLGRCDEGLGAAFQPFVEALTHVAQHTDDERLPSMLGPRAGELLRLVPALESRLPGLSPTRSAEPQTEQFLLFEAVVDWLAAQSADAPVLLVLDDIHWAAEPTLLLLRHVLRSARELQLLVVATYRDTEIDRTHPLGSLLADLRRIDCVQRIALRGLDGDGVAELVERAAGHVLDDRALALAAAIHDETAGNPFFTIEVLLHLAERGTLYRTGDGRWISELEIDEIGIPEGVKEVVGRRLAALPDASEDILHAAAAMGQEIELDVLVTVTGGAEDDVIDAIEAARAAGLVDELGTAPVRYRFAHALVQQTLLDELPTARRLRLHRATAEALERLRAGRLEENAAAIAHHWYEAGTEPSKALGATIRAGHVALGQLADREALRWFERARDLLDDAGSDEGTRIDVLIAIGEAMRRIGDPSHRDVLLEAGRLAADSGDPARMARAALTNGRGWQSSTLGTDVERVEAIEAALEALGGEESAVRAMLLARLSVEIIYDAERRHRRFALADEALELARRVGDPRTLADVLFTRHNAILSHATIDQRQADAAEGARLAAELEDPTLEAQLGTLGYFPKVQACLVDEAEAAHRHGFEVARAIGQPEHIWLLTVEASALARLRGDLDGAEELAAEAHDLGLETGIPDASFFYSYQHLALLIDRGRELGQEDGGGPDHYSGLRFWPACLRLVVVGDVDALGDAVHTLWSMPAAPWGPDPGPDDSHMTGACAIAWGAAALGIHHEEAKTAYDFAAPWPGQLWGNLTWYGPTDAYLAAAAPLAGHPDRVDEHLERALALCREMRAPINDMHARILGACGLRLRDRAGDRDRAARLIDEAIELGDRHGAGYARAAAERFPVLAG